MQMEAPIAEILPDVFRITLPLPGKRPGPVNVYLFRGGENALIDTGTSRSAGLLEKSLRALGLSFRDINTVLVTHGHLEHFGAARRIVRGSRGGVVMAHGEDRRSIERGLEVPWRRYLEYYTLMGVPAGHRLALAALQALFSFYSETCAVGRTLSDGEVVVLGEHRARVISTPGHTRGSVCLYLEEDEALFTGDHILGHITPNAFVMLDTDCPLPRRMSQLEYFDSLRRVELLAPRVAHPAHGAPVENVAETIALYRRQYAERSRRIIEIIGREAPTPYAISRRLFPEIGGARLPLELFLAVSEVYTHLQVLEKEGRVRAVEGKGALRYAA